eukprot:NODE_129_length_3131_cov_49.556132_g119_i0.p1 GENE.NODE_129_length_3131_cov_49.556132_g119_i0~~NODE_129_length_3131_cov_49.556132_g119_i0.p1  ORF type:complete len:934 (+),score=248.95 NODE_129_length_3131_cov_49.556132_g119_i0:228-3029(+)
MPTSESPVSRVTFESQSLLSREVVVVRDGGNAGGDAEMQGLDRALVDDEGPMGSLNLEDALFQLKRKLQNQEQAMREADRAFRQREAADAAAKRELELTLQQALQHLTQQWQKVLRYSEIEESFREDQRLLVEKEARTSQSLTETEARCRSLLQLRDQLLDELQNAKQQIFQLEERCKGLQEALSDTRERKEAEGKMKILIEQCRSLQARLVEQEKSNQVVERRFQQGQSIIGELQQRVKALADERDSLAIQLGETVANKMQLEGMVQRLEGEKEYRARAGEELELRLEQCTMQIGELEAKRKEAEDRMADHVAGKEGLARQNGELQRQAQEAVAAVESIEEQRRILLEQMEECKAGRASLEVLLKQEEENNAKICRELQSRAVNSENIASHLEQRLSQSQDRIIELETKAVQSQEASSSLQEQKRSLETRVEQVLWQNREGEAKIQQLEEELQRLRNENDHLNNEVRRSTDVRFALESEVQLGREAAEREHQARRYLEQVQERLAEYERGVQKLEVKLTEKERRVTDLENQLEQTSSSLQSKEAECSGAQQRQSEYEGQLQAMLVDMQAAVNRVEWLEGESATHADARRRLEDRIEHLCRKVAELETQLCDTEQRAISSAERSKELELKSEELEQQVRSLGSQLAEERRKFSELERRFKGQIGSAFSQLQELSSTATQVLESTQEHEAANCARLKEERFRAQHLESELQQMRRVMLAQEVAWQEHQQQGGGNRLDSTPQELGSHNTTPTFGSYSPQDNGGTLGGLQALQAFTNSLSDGGRSHSVPSRRTPTPANSSNSLASVLENAQQLSHHATLVMDPSRLTSSSGQPPAEPSRRTTSATFIRRAGYASPDRRAHTPAASYGGRLEINRSGLFDSPVRQRAHSAVPMMMRSSEAGGRLDSMGPGGTRVLPRSPPLPVPPTLRRGQAPTKRE